MNLTLKTINLLCIGKADVSRTRLWQKAQYCSFSSDPDPNNSRSGCVLLGKIVIRDSFDNINVLNFASNPLYESWFPCYAKLNHGIIPIIFLDTDIESLDYILALLDKYRCSIADKPVLVIIARNDPKNVIQIDPMEVIRICEKRHYAFLFIDPLAIDNAIHGIISCWDGMSGIKVGV